ncbi:MAG: hypothetical protein FWD73_08890 [Polyangiaceae bacterium]|nr:hypothetical protein [Polyangiaceae bacterium]
MLRLLPLLLVLSILPGCSAPKSARPPNTHPSNKALKTATPLVLVGSNAPRDTAWMPNGDVVAVSDGRLWRFRPGDKENIVHMTPVAATNAWLVTAKSADLAIVFGDESKAYPFRDGKALAPFDIGTSGTSRTVDLSEDGSVLTVEVAHEEEDGSVVRTATAYDVAKRTRVSTFSTSGDRLRYGQLSPDGAWMITNEGIVATRDGTVVVGFDTDTMTLGGMWVDGKAIVWQEGRPGEGWFVIADPLVRSSTRVDLCSDMNFSSDMVFDRAMKRVVYHCEGKIFVVEMDGSHRAFQVNARHGRPTLFFSQTGNELIVDSRSPWEQFQKKGDPPLPIDAVDLVSGASRSLDALPPLRNGDGTVFFPRGQGRWLQGTKSPDENLVLSGATVLDRTAQHDLVRWGPPNVWGAKSNLAAFVHEGGLEVVAEMKGTSTLRTVRVGSAPRTPLVVPPLSRRAPCKEDPFAPRAIDNDRTTFPLIYRDGPCACDVNGCHPSDEFTYARYGTKALVLGDFVPVNEDGTEEGPPHQPGDFGNIIDLVNAEGRRTKMPMTSDAVDAATFLDDGKTAVFVKIGEWKKGASKLHKVALDTLAVTSSSLPEFEFETVWEYEMRDPVQRYERPYEIPTVQIMVTDKSFVVTEASTTMLEARIFERGSNQERAVVFAWPGQAIVKLPNGRIELAGDVDVGALGCLDAEGNLHPFATCRDQVEVTGAFHIE